jgi:hypothetical protein
MIDSGFLYIVIENTPLVLQGFSFTGVSMQLSVLLSFRDIRSSHLGYSPCRKNLILMIPVLPPVWKRRSF